MSTPPSNELSHPQSYPNSFYQAHHFNINNSTFVDNSGNIRRLEELKVDLKNTVIRRATYEELPRWRRDQFDGFEAPHDIEEWIKNPDDSFEHHFLKSSSKDVLSLSGIPLVRYFRNNVTPGIKLVAHILFYDIPITEDALIISTRPNVSHRWVTTIAYQLMLSIPEITIPMLEALHLDPNIPRYNSEEQLLKLIVSPFQSVVERGLLSSNDTLLILLDCIDCSTDAPLMARDIACLIDQLESISDLRLKLLVTGLPAKKVLDTFSKVSILTSDLPSPKQIYLPTPQPSFSIQEFWSGLSVLQKKYYTELLMGTGTLSVGGMVSLKTGSAIALYLASGLVGLFAVVEATLTATFFAMYLTLKIQRPWDVHGRMEAVKRSILEYLDSIAVAQYNTR